MLSARLPGVSSGASLTYAVNSATAFVNTWTSRKYDPWDDFQESPEVILAPAEIGEICLQVAEAYYFIDIGQTTRDGNEDLYWDDFLERKKEELKEIGVSPTWETQTISLDSNDCMLIGSRSATGGMWPRVIPFTAQVISATTNIWIQPDDYTIRMGGDYTDEYPDAWYLDVNTGSSVEGTLRYMRTYRKDTIDYMRYGQ